MKSLMHSLIVLTLLLSLGLSACGDNDVANEPGPIPSQSVVSLALKNIATFVYGYGANSAVLLEFACVDFEAAIEQDGVDNILKCNVSGEQHVLLQEEDTFCQEGPPRVTSIATVTELSDCASSGPRLAAENTLPMNGTMVAKWSTQEGNLANIRIEFESSNLVIQENTYEFQLTAIIDTVQELLTSVQGSMKINGNTCTPAANLGDCAL